jgi:hypothetical protein
MNKFKLLLLTLLSPIVVLGVSPQAAGAFSLFGDNVCSGNAKNSPTCQQAKKEGGNDNNRITGPKNIIKTAATIMALVTGIAAVIMIIISGFTMVTSGGNSESVASARRRLIAAVIGLIIVALAWTIITFTATHLLGT